MTWLTNTTKTTEAFIEASCKTGDAVVVNEEVDWDLEMGAIVRRICEKKGPRPISRSIKDYPGFEALGAPIATYRRLAIALGLEPDDAGPGDRGRIPEENVGHGADHADGRRQKGGALQGGRPSWATTRTS